MANKSKKPWIIAGVVVAVLAIGSVGASDESDDISADDITTFNSADITGDYVLSDNKISETTSLTTAAPETTAPETTEAEPEIKTYKEGMYKVGTDIPAGEYLLIATDKTFMSYMCVSSDGNQSDILTNDNFYNYHYVTLENGQYFKIQRCAAVPADEYKLSLQDNIDLKEGMYKIGRDIPAGEYKLSQTGTDFMAYYCIYNNSTAGRDIVANDNFNNNSYVTVKNGQYLVLNRCTASLLE